MHIVRSLQYKNLLGGLLSIVLVLLLFGQEVRAQLVWKPIMVGIGTDSQYLRDVSFGDELTGVAVGEYGVAYRTTNGGAEWVAIQPVACSQCLVDYSSVRMFNANEVYAWGRISSKDQTGEFTIRSMDGGVRWTMLEKAIPASQYLASISQLFDGGVDQVEGSGDPVVMHVYAARSSDQGASWTLLYEENASLWTGRGGYVIFGDSVNYMIVKDMNDPELLQSKGTDRWLHLSRFFSKVHYWGEGNWGAIDPSGDLYQLHGQSWTQNGHLDSVLNVSGYGDGRTALVRFKDTALHKDQVARTHDGGATWSIEHLQLSNFDTYANLRWASPDFTYFLTSDHQIVRSAAASGVRATAPVAIAPWPNPASKISHIPGLQTGSVDFIDPLGRSVQLSISDGTFDCSRLPNGVYRFVTTFGCGRLVVQH